MLIQVDAKLKYRPQIDDLAENEEDEENGDGMNVLYYMPKYGNSNALLDKDKKYVAPKISAMRYEDERGT